MHAICDGCEARVDAGAAVCESCGAERPDVGWPHVTELRVYTSGEDKEQVVHVPTPRPLAERVQAPEPVRADESEAETTVHTVVEDEDEDQSDDTGASTDRLPPLMPTPTLAPTQEPAPPRAARGAPGVLGTYVRLGMSFTLTFGFTATVVLGAWFGVLRPEGGLVLNPEPPQPTVIVREVPVPVPEPVVVVEPEPDAVADVEPEPEPVAAAPKPRPRRTVRPRPRPAPAPAPEPVAVVEPEPEPDVFSEPAALPEPPAPVVIPAAAARQAGVYVGKSQGNPVSIELLFLPDDVVEATLKLSEREDTITMSATGSYTIGEDGVVTISLVENGTLEPRVYSGTVSEGKVIGRVIEGGRARGRFNARR